MACNLELFHRRHIFIFIYFVDIVIVIFLDFSNRL